MTRRCPDLPVAPVVQEATAIQRQASQPGLSVVLKAGAGSGKTSALTSRFLRLCIESATKVGDVHDPGPVPVHPRSILAITFTRKAAVEIRQRLLKQAIALATASEQELENQLCGLLGRMPTTQEKTRGAGLYEQILEHPQGLKIGTIHQFCQLILNRFAVEAGLDPGYTVLDDPSELIDEALDAMEKVLALDDEMSTEARRLGNDPAAIRKVLRRVFISRMRLERWCDRVVAQQDVGDPGSGRQGLVPFLKAELKGILMPDPGSDQEFELADMLTSMAGLLENFASAGMDGVLQELGSEASQISDTSKNKLRDTARNAAIACGDSAMNCRAATGPAAIASAERASRTALEQARNLLLTKDGKPRAFFRGRKNPDLNERFQKLVLGAGEDILAGVRRFALRDLYLKNASLLHLGLGTLDIYDGLKQRDRVVDFQDLEALSCRLMGDEERAMSLLFRLDDSITHIMVDEYQDTNFNQRDILKPLIDDFLSGGSGQTSLPTVFFVGDVKQSIYGFRGAEPGIFEALIHDFKAREASGDPAAWGGVRVLSLPTNFRSLPAVTAGVTGLFSHSPLAVELGPEGGRDLAQHCARDEAPGEFYVLPPFTPADDGTGDNGDQLAATAAASLVKKLVTGGTNTWVKGSRPVELRPLAWRDILVLFRTRTRVGLYEDAFRQAHIPISPSGRGALASSREVQDLLALLRWLVWPEDDIALASVLRSPLFRLSQNELQTVLARRGLHNRKSDGSGYHSPRGLWSVIRGDDTDPITGRAVRLLTRWRKRSGYEHCHDLVRTIYREGEVLARYRAALGDQGDQAVYNLMRIHDLTLGRELASLPTVRQLILLLERAVRTGGQEEGLVPDATEGGRVRFMTIHGAKGLEAPVVLFVDADAATGKEDAQVILDPDNPCSALLFATTKQDRHQPDLPTGDDSDPVAAAAQVSVRKDRVEEANLEYVAMTRARDRLYILGGDKSNKRDNYDSPLRRILLSAEAANDPRIKRELPPELVAGAEQDKVVVPIVDAEIPDSAGSLPGFHPWSAPTVREKFRILTPSAGHFADQGGHQPAAKVAGKKPGTEAAVSGSGGIQRGLLVHALLEAAARQGRMPPGSGPQWQEAESVFTASQLQWVFQPQDEGWQGLSEVPVIAERPTPGPGGVRERITGVIDRLILRPGRVDIVDFKTNRCAGTPGLQDRLVEHYRPQLAMYQEVLALARPEQDIHMWLLFTDPDLDPDQRLIALV